MIEYIPNALNYLKIDVGREIIHCDNSRDNYIYTRYGFQLKHSPNIIDLIEEGDYVNGFEVMRFDDMYDKETDTYEDGLAIPIYDDALMDCIEEVRPLSTLNIKSIVTKEQFAEMEYKV